MALQPAKLTDFDLAGPLGNGASARVYDAVHRATGRPVAIKRIAEHALLDGDEVRERFAREALLLAGVDSRHVSKILGFGFDRGKPFLVLERLRGETLDAKLRREGPVSPAIAVRWIEQLILGVRDCHAAHIIHRDIKPSNLFLHVEESGTETLKLIDFGVARLMQLAGETGLTSPGDLIGSMGYMAPEQFERAPSVGWPADLYAVGVVVFRMLTGRLPFISRSLEAAFRMKMEQPVPLVSSLSVVKSAALDAFVQRAMARDPADRFQSAREMLDEWSAVAPTIDSEEDGPATTRRMGRDDASTVVPDSDLPPTAFVQEEATLSRSALARATWPDAPPAPASCGESAQGLGRADTVSERGGVTRVAPPFDSEPFELETRSDPDLGRRIRLEVEKLEHMAKRGRE